MIYLTHDKLYKIVEHLGQIYSGSDTIFLSLLSVTTISCSANTYTNTLSV